MKILQILKSEPDEVIKKLMEPISKDNESQADPFSIARTLLTAIYWFDDIEIS
jgi:hypothetical protein